MVAQKVCMFQDEQIMLTGTDGWEWLRGLEGPLLGNFCLVSQHISVQLGPAKNTEI